jgi:hypothetical protein
VEQQVEQIPPEAPPALHWLRIIIGRHVCAFNCHQFDQGHPVTRWIGMLSDPVVMALIRENAYWLRNGAVTDRICRRRLELLTGDATARAFLGQLLSASPQPSKRHRPTSGPRFASSILREALETAEAQAREDQALWRRVREAGPDSVTLGEVGEAFLRRQYGRDAPDAPRSTPAQVTKHLGRHRVLVRPVNDDRTRWVCIDDPGWPRASVVALVAARWRVSKGWMLKKVMRRTP